MTTVELRELTKEYERGVTAVADLSLMMAAGEITALLGPSGCGKTTVLKLIAGLLTPTRGDVLFDGRSVRAVPAEKRGAVMVFQNHLLFPYMSVGDNVGFGLKMRGLDRATIRRRVDEMLALVQLPGMAARRPSQLSGGQQQRVALARALVVEPAVLLLDEPLSNLDAHLREEMRDLIVDVQQQTGTTTVMVTHDREEAALLAQRIGLMFDGRLQQVGAARDFYERPLTQQVAHFFGGRNFIDGVRQNGVVCTAAGALAVAAPARPDGPVTLTIRPEQIRLVEAGCPAENVLGGELVRCRYTGTAVQLDVETAVGPLRIHTDAATPGPHTPGQRLHLHLPPDRIWLLPRSSSQMNAS